MIQTRRRRGTPQTLAAIAFLALTLGPARAQDAAAPAAADPQTPVEITAEALSVDQAGGIATFTGEVKMVQGDMRLTAEKVVVTYAADRSEITRVEATGRVLLVTATEAAEGDRATYDMATGQILMEGNVLLTQDGSAASGERLAVDTRTNTARLEGGVRTVFQPGAGQKDGQKDGAKAEGKTQP